MGGDGEDLAVSFRVRGVQPRTWVSGEPQWVSCLPGPPSTGTRWISGTRLRQLVYARWLPSGQKRGWPTFVRSTVSRQARPGSSRGASQRSSLATKHS
ncbi:hypothetical protein SALBM311S_11004 [Streptomyces alboniger]